jgi:Zinc-binding loop region of homing endonuclease
MSSSDQKKKNKKRSNKPRKSSKNLQTWDEAVWATAAEKLKKNLNSKGKPYYKEVRLPGAPDQVTPCHYPVGSQFFTLTSNNFTHEYQMKMHRWRLCVSLWENNQPLPTTPQQQASHLCMDVVNEDGRGSKHCVNPLHMVIEDDKTNKSRQRCAGWIYIHQYENNVGGFWYPSCLHNPPCLRFTPIEEIPTVVTAYNEELAQAMNTD